MGLDLAEFLMDAEDLYGIRIDDTNASWPASTLQDFVSLILVELDAQNPGRLKDEQLVFNELKGILIDRFKVDPRKITLEARLIQDLGLD